MPIKFACAQCGQKHQVDEVAAGRRIACRKCGAAMRIPAPSPSAADSDVWLAPDAPPPASKAPSSPPVPAPSPADSDVFYADDPTPAPAPVVRKAVPPPAPRPRAVANPAPAYEFESEPEPEILEFEIVEEDEPAEIAAMPPRVGARPKPPRPAGAGASRGKVAAATPWRERFLWGGIVLVLAGVVLLAIGRREKILAGRSSAVPQQTTLAGLIAQHERGEIPNAHVEVGDLRFFDSWVFSRSSRSTQWSCVWVPITPAGGGPPGALAVPVRAVVKSVHVQGEDQLGELLARKKVRGMVINDIESLGGHERQLLTEAFPAPTSRNA